jgi:hypothetical protein
MYWRNSQKLLGWAIFETGACPYHHHQNSSKSDQKKRELKAATYSEKKTIENHQTSPIFSNFDTTIEALD